MEEEEQRISSDHTELLKIAGVLAAAISLALLLFLILWMKVGIGASLLLIGFITAVIVYSGIELFRLKEVFATKTGFLIKSRVFFWEKCIFVPFDEILSIEPKSSWFLDGDHLQIKFLNETELGKEITFHPRGLEFGKPRLDLHEIREKMLTEANRDDRF